LTPLTDAYLAAVLPLEEYQRRRLELEGSRGRHHALAGMVQLIEAFCQRVQQGLAELTFEQKRHLIELLLDRVVVTNEKVEICYAIPTSPTVSIFFFVICGWAISMFHLLRCLRHRI
jgi:site-specific DNA recombinase